MQKILVWIAAALALGIMSQTAAAQVIEVTAIYRERIAPPPDARLVSVLLDVSRADAPAAELGRTEIADAGMPPYQFEIAYDPAAIDPAHRYAVRSTLFAGERMMFTTDTHVPVLTQGASDRAEITMVRVAQERGELEDRGALSYGLSLPASFAGRLPCADCEAVEHHLDLWPDQAFHLRRTWIGGSKDGTVQSDLGLWSALPEDNALKLWGLGDAPDTWRVVDTQTLRAIDAEGDVAADTLTGDGSLSETDLEDMFLGGMMSYMADAATFTECATKRSYPIAQEGDYLALERAYLEQAAGPGAPLYVHVEGSLLMRPAMEGPDRRSLVVDRFIRTRPGITCERQRADAALTGTYWKIDSLRGAPVEIVEDAREPHLLLTEGEDARYAATMGCNQMVGGYEASDDSLTLAVGAATLMACPPPLDTMERKLGEVLSAVRGYAISGETLALKDDAGEVIALMTAVYFR
ncbi:YbaY family lipoprotein [Roseovarius dicentrarchi]|uniref:YbaY family lipoprotein n=1 Tax=Roseovarius dicentrarchi TaxID=2250573 RepID=UPI000DE847A6|nr:YbaY family lipoprotein [Roseovarius dicentrarchi]